MDTAAIAAAAGARYAFSCRKYGRIVSVPLKYDCCLVNILFHYKRDTEGVVLRSDQRAFYWDINSFLARHPDMELWFRCILGITIPQSVKVSILDEVLELARSMVNDDLDNNARRKVQHIVVDLEITLSEEEIIDLTMGESIVSEAIKGPSFSFPVFIESHVEGLEKFALGHKKECEICLETIKLRTHMPCSHIYDANCLDRWLEKNNSCPICRYQCSKNR